jgi:hypothetical protein
MDNFSGLLIIYCIILIIGTRTLSAYSPSLVFQSTFDLKSKFLYYLLVDRSITRYLTKNKRKENEQKITLVGVIFYIIILIALIVACIVLFALPKAVCEEFDMGKFGFKGNTYNELFVSNLLQFILFTEFTAYIINTLNVGNPPPRKIYLVLCIVSAVSCGLLSLILFFEMSINLSQVFSY